LSVKKEGTLKDRTTHEQNGILSILLAVSLGSYILWAFICCNMNMLDEY